MDLENNLKIANLLDRYSVLLTVHQKNIMSLYFYNNLSLQEIAVNLGITKQAVSDIISRTQTFLEKTEEKLKLNEKTLKITLLLSKIQIADKDKTEILNILKD